jgi:hypothetical protein
LGKAILAIKIVLKKLILKALAIPVFKHWFGRVIQHYDRTQIKKEGDVLAGKQTSRLNFSHYLPDTEARIERLRRVINGRPVAIILHGPSARELEARVTELKDCDICYFGLNAFRTPETSILQKIGRTYSVVMYSAIEYGVDSQIDNVIAFLDRQEDNMFISERDSFYVLEKNGGFSLDKFIQKYDKKLLFITGVPTITITIESSLYLRTPSLEYPLHFLRQSSFSILLSLALIGEAPMVVVFGGDGGRIKGEDLYYRDSASKLSESILEQSLAFDTKVFNMTMPVMLDKIYKMYNLKSVDIVNCSMWSNYTPMRKLSYDDTFALLKSFQKDKS